MNKKPYFQRGTRCVIVVTLLANAWILACGHPIDTTVPSDVAPDGGNGRLPDGGIAPGPANPDGATSDGSPATACTSAFVREFGEDYASSVAGWSVHSSPPFDGGITSLEPAGTIPGRLGLQGVNGAPAYLERTLSPGCDEVRVTLRFDFLVKQSFDLLSVAFGPPEAPTKRVTVAYVASLERLAIGAIAGNNSTERQGFGLSIQTRDPRDMYLVVKRNGAAWASIDSAPDLGAAPNVAGSSIEEADPITVRVGVDNVASGADNTVELMKITIVPP